MDKSVDYAQPKQKETSSQETQGFRRKLIFVVELRGLTMILYQNQDNQQESPFSPGDQNQAVSKILKFKLENTKLGFIQNVDSNYMAMTLRNFSIYHLNDKILYTSNKNAKRPLDDTEEMEESDSENEFR